MRRRQPRLLSQDALSDACALRDAAVRDLLTALAPLLVPAGVTPKRFNEIARRVFVDFAASLATRRTGKTNHARVAALTGLGRGEIRRLLSEREPSHAVDASLAAPIQRVLAGWLSDARFQGNQPPNRLALRGAKRSFAELARRHGGDATYRAVLDELRRFGLVQLDRTRNRVALGFIERSEWHRLVTQLATVSPTLATAIQTAATANRSRVSVVEARFYPKDEIDRLLVQKSLDPAVQSFVTGLKGSFSAHRPRSKPKSGYEVAVSVLVSDGPIGISPRRERTTPTRKAIPNASNFQKGTRR
jgi:hypothetical protein